MTDEYHNVPCPHPECEGELHVRSDTPAGVYDCICKGCKVMLCWVTYVHGARKPIVTLERSGSDFGERRLEREK